MHRRVLFKKACGDEIPFFSPSLVPSPTIVYDKHHFDAWRPVGEDTNRKDILIQNNSSLSLVLSPAIV
jgi:hypothetical protein